MSNCDIEIIFDKYDAVYAVGEKINCTVSIASMGCPNCKVLLAVKVTISAER